MENALEYAVTVCRGQTVLPEDLPELESSAAGHPADSGRQVAIRPVRARSEAPAAAELRAVLDAHRWRRADAARALGISRITLWRRMQAAGLLQPEA
jgi:transcriptional regulator of acetoin/glycerol metabolism